MFAVLAHIRPLNLKTNTRVDVRVASSATPAAHGLGGFTWESAMTRRPKGVVELFAMDLTAGTQVAAADFEINLAEIQELDASALHWKGAPVTIYRADSLTWPAPVEFDGYVLTPGRDLEKDTLTLSCRTALRYDKPLLTREMADSGFTFDADRRTVLLPAGFGECRNLEPVLVDANRSIYMLDGYGNLLNVWWTGEGLSSLGPNLQNFGTYAEMVTAIDAGAVPPGRWATCTGAGLICLGAPPAGVITCHAQFGYGMTGAMIRRIVVDHAGVSLSSLEDSSFTALDNAVPYPIHYWTDEQQQVDQLAEQLAAGCNASPIVTLQGKLALVRPFGGDLVGTFRRYGFSEPAVTDWKTNDTVTPFWRVVTRVARPIRVMDFGEIQFEDDLVDRGLYDNAETYRSGNIVWLRNKSQWLYRYDIPTAGHAPPDGTAGDIYWRLLAPSPDASDIHYLDGQTLEVLQPEEANAQITRVINVSVPEISFTFDDAGNLVNGQVPYTIRASVSAANYDVTLTSDWSISPSAGITAEIDNSPSSPNRGEIRILALTGAGTIEVHALSGNVALSTTIKVNKKGALADKSLADTADIVVGAVTGAASFVSTDVAITATETTLIETPFFSIGDAAMGVAIAQISFLQDSTVQKDTAARVITYVDTGTGYEIAQDRTRGIVTNDGSSKWALDANYTIRISATTPIRIMVTVQGVKITGDGFTTGSYARDPGIDIFRGQR
ncbi:MAG: hypothetical protein ABW128_06770 [Rhizorhabdus sp.]